MRRSRAWSLWNINVETRWGLDTRGWHRTERGYSSYDGEKRSLKDPWGKSAVGACKFLKMRLLLKV